MAKPCSRKGLRRILRRLHPKGEARAVVAMHSCAPCTMWDANGRRKPVEEKQAVPQAPASFYCPVSMELMADPVIVATGHTYDRRCIETWLAQGNRTCPVTGMRLRHLELVSNHALRNAIEVGWTSSRWCSCHSTVLLSAFSLV